MVEAAFPIFPPVTGHQQSKLPAGQPTSAVSCGQGAGKYRQRIDPGVAGHEYFPPGLLFRQVDRIAFGRDEQQVGESVDRDAIFLLRPGLTEIMAPQSRLHVRQSNAGVTRRKRAAKGAGGVPLDHQQVGSRQRKDAPQCGPHQIGMKQRVRLAGTAQWRRGEPRHAMLGQFQSRMLPGDEQSRRLAQVGKRLGDRAQLDGFWTSSDDKRDT